MVAEKIKNLSKDERKRLEGIAEEILHLQFMFWKMRHLNRIDDPYDLSESEYATLDTLSQNPHCTVGELQKMLDVRAAQMSRIIRSLEDKGGAKLVECSINPEDKRKIDVTITSAGKKAYDEYRRRRLYANLELLMRLDRPEQENLKRLLESYRKIISKRLNNPE